MLTEEVGLLASDHRRKEPLTVNRPYDKATPTETPAAPGGTTGAGVLGMFATLSQAGTLNVVVDPTPGVGGDG